MTTTIINTKLYFKVKYYQIIMMKKRGFVIPADEEKVLTDYNYFLQKYIPREKGVYLQNNLENVYNHSSKDNKRITKVIYIREEDETKDQILKGTTEEIKKIINSTPNIYNYILISRVKFRTASLTELRDLVSFNIEIFLHDELFYDPTIHELQPKMELLSLENSQKFLAQNRDNKNIKKTCYDDPIVKFLGGILGQIIIVNRKTSYQSQVENNMEYRLINNRSIYEGISDKL